MRDNFSVLTKSILAQRVAFRCSNPDCRCLTIGPHSEKQKSTKVGVAAHITAASEGGPRYNSKLSTEERKEIGNGIWLCVSCSTLIDKDESAYSEDTLQAWKAEAEDKASKELLRQPEGNSKPLPFIESDLIWSNAGRRFVSYSEKNFELGKERVIRAGDDNIINYNLHWNFKFVLHNNSSVPAFNLSIEQIAGNTAIFKSKLPKINNVPPLGNVGLEIEFQDTFEGHFKDIDEQLSTPYPNIIIGSQFKISYLDEGRKKHFTLIRFEKDGIINESGSGS